MKQKTLILGILAILCVAACIALLDTVTSFSGPSDNTTVSNTSVNKTPVTTAKVTATVTAKTTTKAVVNVTTTKAAANVTATKATVNVTAKATTAVTSSPVTTLPSYTTAQIYLHLIDIAFSADNNKISKINATTEKIAIAGSYTDQDLANLNTFRRQFNNVLSSTSQISEPSAGDQGNIIISFLPGKSLENLASDNSYNTINGKQVINRDNDGTICSIYRTITYQSTSSNNVYVNNDLTGDKRAHYLLRGLLYYLGFLGQTSTYRDSMFYSEPNSITNLSVIDVRAIQLMYGSKITNGMTVSSIKAMY